MGGLQVMAAGHRGTQQEVEVGDGVHQSIEGGVDKNLVR